MSDRFGEALRSLWRFLNPSFVLLVWDHVTTRKTIITKRRNENIAFCLLEYQSSSSHGSPQTDHRLPCFAGCLRWHSLQKLSSGKKVYGICGAGRLAQHLQRTTLQPKSAKTPSLLPRESFTAGMPELTVQCARRIYRLRILIDTWETCTESNKL